MQTTDHLLLLFELKGMINAISEQDEVDFGQVETINDKINTLAAKVLEHPESRVIGIASSR